MISPPSPFRPDPFASALEAILRFYTPDLDPKHLALWQELRAGFLDGLAEHRRAMQKLAAADALALVAEDLVEEALEPTSYLHGENTQAAADTRRIILDTLQPALEHYLKLP